MIGIYDDAGNRLAMGYSGLTINDEIYPVGIVAVDPRYDAVVEPHAQRNGMEAHAPRELVNMIRIEGIVKADSVAQLHDRVDALNAAFDPVLATESDDSTENAGFLPFTFSVPTTDTTNYPTGLKPLQYFGRSVALPVPRVSKFEGDGARFTILLQCADPRRYLQTLSTATRFSIGSLVADNSLATYPSWPIVTLRLNAATPNIVFLTLNGVLLTIDLRDLAAVAQRVRIDMERKTVELSVDAGLNWTDRMDLYASGNYWRLEPASNIIVVSGSLNGHVDLSWRRAFV